MPQTVLRLQNLSWSASAHDVRFFFEGCEIPSGGVRIIGGEKGECFVVFNDGENAKRALYRDGNYLNNEKISLFPSSMAELEHVVAVAKGEAPAPPVPSADQLQNILNIVKNASSMDESIDYNREMRMDLQSENQMYNRDNDWDRHDQHSMGDDFTHESSRISIPGLGNDNFHEESMTADYGTDMGGNPYLGAPQNQPYQQHNEQRYSEEGGRSMEFGGFNERSQFENRNMQDMQRPNNSNFGDPTVGRRAFDSADRGRGAGNFTGRGGGFQTSQPDLHRGSMMGNERGGRTDSNYSTGQTPQRFGQPPDTQQGDGDFRRDRPDNQNVQVMQQNSWQTNTNQFTQNEPAQKPRSILRNSTQGGKYNTGTSQPDPNLPSNQHDWSAQQPPVNFNKQGMHPSQKSDLFPTKSQIGGLFPDANKTITGDLFNREQQQVVVPQQMASKEVEPKRPSRFDQRDLGRSQPSDSRGNQDSRDRSLHDRKSDRTETRFDKKDDRTGSRFDKRDDRTGNRFDKKDDRSRSSDPSRSDRSRSDRSRSSDRHRSRDSSRTDEGRMRYDDRRSHTGGRPNDDRRDVRRSDSSRRTDERSNRFQTREEISPSHKQAERRSGDNTPNNNNGMRQPTDHSPRDSDQSRNSPRSAPSQQPPHHLQGASPGRQDQVPPQQLGQSNPQNQPRRHPDANRMEPSYGGRSGPPSQLKQPHQLVQHNQPHAPQMHGAVDPVEPDFKRPRQDFPQQSPTNNIPPQQMGQSSGHLRNQQQNYPEPMRPIESANLDRGNEPGRQSLLATPGGNNMHPLRPGFSPQSSQNRPRVPTPNQSPQFRPPVGGHPRMNAPRESAPSNLRGSAPVRAAGIIQQTSPIRHDTRSPDGGHSQHSHSQGPRNERPMASQQMSAPPQFMGQRPSRHNAPSLMGQRMEAPPAFMGQRPPRNDTPSNAGQRMNAPPRPTVHRQPRPSMPATMLNQLQNQLNQRMSSPRQHTPGVMERPPFPQNMNRPSPNQDENIHDGKDSRRDQRETVQPQRDTRDPSQSRFREQNRPNSSEIPPNESSLLEDRSQKRASLEPRFKTIETRDSDMRKFSKPLLPSPTVDRSQPSHPDSDMSRLAGQQMNRRSSDNIPSLLSSDQFSVRQNQKPLIPTPGESPRPLISTSGESPRPLIPTSGDNQRTLMRSPADNQRPLMPTPGQGMHQGPPHGRGPPANTPGPGLLQTPIDPVIPGPPIPQPIIPGLGVPVPIQIQSDEVIAVEDPFIRITNLPRQPIANLRRQLRGLFLTQDLSPLDIVIDHEGEDAVAVCRFTSPVESVNCLNELFGMKILSNVITLKPCKEEEFNEICRKTNYVNQHPSSDNRSGPTQTDEPRPDLRNRIDERQGGSSGRGREPQHGDRSDRGEKSRSPRPRSTRGRDDRSPPRRERSPKHEDYDGRSGRRSTEVGGSNGRKDDRGEKEQRERSSSRSKVEVKPTPDRPKEQYWVELTGLQYSTTVNDVMEAFSALNVQASDVYLALDTNDECTGTGFLQLKSLTDKKQFMAGTNFVGSTLLTVKDISTAEKVNFEEEHAKWLEGIKSDESGKYYVQLVGLPFEADHSMISKFLHPAKIQKDSLTICVNAQKRCNGFGFVKLYSAEDRDEALKHDRAYIGKRYIVVKPSNSKSMQSVLENQIVQQKPQSPLNASADEEEQRVVCMNNLRYDVKPLQILHFFREYSPEGDSLKFTTNNGMPTGRATIKMSSVDKTIAAVTNLNKTHLAGRPILLNRIQH